MTDSSDEPRVDEEMILNYHLMHPGAESSPGDPNAAFCLDGTYHLHYILRHPWRGKPSFSFVHVTSPDMLHWSWQTTKLQPAFTGHGMFSGTGFLTTEGRPAVIYHGYYGKGAGDNYLALGTDRSLSAWEKPYRQELAPAAEAPEISFWDPDCFVIGDTYYSISGGREQPLLKSTDLQRWSYAGDFLAHELPDVALGEDISCPNFFPLDGKWMLLCISHPFGCRYYLGDWDAGREQFVPQSHGRMNWPRQEDPIYQTEYRDFFAPESVLTPDGRRVMWAWLRSLDERIKERTIQSLPRELSLGPDGSLRQRPLRELESLRYDAVTLTDVTASPPVQKHSATSTEYIAQLDGDSYEILITVARAEALRKRFAVRLFADDTGAGLPIMLRPEAGTLRVGTTEAPFAVADLPEGEDLRLRIFIDKYLVEVFANDRQAVVPGSVDGIDHSAPNRVALYAYGASITLRKVEIWRLRATNAGLHEARDSRVWAPLTE